MAIGGDVDPGPVLGSFDRSRLVRRKQFRMNRPAKDVHDMFSNRRTN